MPPLYEPPSDWRHDPAPHSQRGFHSRGGPDHACTVFGHEGPPAHGACSSANRRHASRERWRRTDHSDPPLTRLHTIDRHTARRSDAGSTGMGGWVITHVREVPSRLRGHRVQSDRRECSDRHGSVRRRVPGCHHYMNPPLTGGTTPRLTLRGGSIPVGDPITHVQSLATKALPLTGHAPQQTGVTRRASVGGGRITPTPQQPAAWSAGVPGSPCRPTRLILAAPNARPRAHAAEPHRRKPPVAACTCCPLLAPSSHALDARCNRPPMGPPRGVILSGTPRLPHLSKIEDPRAHRSASSISCCST